VNSATLPRVLEPEVMDSAEEARDYDAMDHAAVNDLFVADFRAAWNGDGPVLDVGTGTAQIPIALCRRVPDVGVVGVDAAESMLAVGRDNVSRSGLADRIRLRRADAKGLPFADGSFAAVMSNSIIHHIPEPATVVAEMVRVLRPGGSIFVRDLLRPENEPILRSLVSQYAAGANDHQRRMFADSLHAALTLAEVRRLVAAVGMDTAVRQTSDRHWTWSAMKPGRSC
jgi:ubiquinone/menaquinone biosynthesis C-methylase UbiE